MKGYENTPRTVDRYTNMNEPFLVEVMAVRTWQCLNGRASLDWTYENCVVYTIRAVSPAFRVATFLTGVYLIFLSWFVQSWPMVFRYNLFLENGSMKPGNVTINACMILWALNFKFMATAYYFTWSSSKGEGWWLWSTLGFRPHGWLSTLVIAAVCNCVAVVGIILVHTVLSHMWQAQNVWFAVLLLLQCAMLVVATLGDAINIGSPWGVQRASRIASVLLGLRLIALMPVTLIFSVASVFSAWPPSYCLQC